ncbi:MAG: hypothetical protein HY602_03245 [Parcubacteria group bacterium]|nr:hypothetical protein [Parcubacteria group bacterium]
MKILLRLWGSPDNMGFAEGRDEGGSVKELYKKGLVEPAGRVGRRIRWRLTSGKLKEEDVVSMKKLATPQYSSYEIIKWSDGFQLASGSLSLIASFIVRKENFAAGFAFRVGYLDWVAKQLKQDDLIDRAKKIIKNHLDNKEIKSLDEFTFEFRSTDFIKVDDPEWWNKST